MQKRLVAPEVRIYVIGQSAFAFEVRSNSLDYRVNQDAELILLPDGALRKFGTGQRADFDRKRV